MKLMPRPEQFNPEGQPDPKPDDSLHDESGEKPKPTEALISLEEFLEEARAKGKLDATDVDTLVEKSSSEYAMKLINESKEEGKEGKFDILKQAIIGGEDGRPQLTNLNLEVAKEIYKQDPKFVLKYIDRFTQLDGDLAKLFLKPEKSVLQKTYEHSKKSLALMTAEEIAEAVDQPSVIARNIDHFSEKDHDQIAQLLIDEHNDPYLLDNFSKFKQLTVATLDKMLNSLFFQEFGVRAFLENIHNFQNTAEQHRAVRMLLAEGYILKNLGELENLDPVIADALVEAGRVDLVSQYSSKGTFSDLSEYAKQKVAKYRDTKN